MVSPITARGNVTRQANKKLRRQRILDTAKNLIASQGFEAFTLIQLAREAGVSSPTIHNLFGKKDDIFQELVSQMVNTISQALSNPDMSGPIEGAEVFTDNLLNLYREDEAFYRSVFMAAERTRLFDPELSSGIFHQSLRIAQRLCTRALEDGFLQGNIETAKLAKELLACQRLARHDWVNGYIDLDGYRQQVLTGIYITYAADATPDFHHRLCQKIQALKISR